MECLSFTLLIRFIFEIKWKHKVYQLEHELNFYSDEHRLDLGSHLQHQPSGKHHVEDNLVRGIQSSYSFWAATSATNRFLQNQYGYLLNSSTICRAFKDCQNKLTQLTQDLEVDSSWDWVYGDYGVASNNQKRCYHSASSQAQVKPDCSQNKLPTDSTVELIFCAGSASPPEKKLLNCSRAVRPLPFWLIIKLQKSLLPLTADFGSIRDIHSTFLLHRFSLPAAQTVLGG